MNTITQIENALKAINQASFQILINHLLYLQGNKFIGSPGATVGKEKTSKGTPDSFFFNGDKYLFVEATTKEKLGDSKSFFQKLSKDIDHCFNEKETKISKNKIGKVILACTEKITANEHNLLNEKVRLYNPEAEFEILNIQNLPLQLYDFPNLSEQYLNVKIAIGEIFTLEAFLEKSSKGLQPSLKNEFIGREEELKKCTEALNKYDRLLLSGGSGVGKSKLAVKILEELSKQDYIPIVILSSAVPLWDDFKHFFRAGKKHIILFDDANKSIQNLNYLLSFIDRQKPFSIKAVITSRDYVKKQVSNSLSEHLYEEVCLSEFKDEEIEKIIVEVLPNLKHHNDIKRKIIELAKGNARVALMATYSVTPESETNYLSSPVLLYERYFKKISDEIGIFDKPIILKSLAIVSFFGVLDRTNEELKTTLSSNFDIDWNDLWSSIMELHNHEILDVYSNEIAKVSDQVLATYAFYKCFIDDKTSVVKYSEWIMTFVEKYSYRIRFTLIDTNNTFNYHHIKELVSPHLNEVIKTLKESNSDEQLYSFYHLFWIYKGRQCLLYLKNWLKNLPQEQNPEIFKFSYEHNNHVEASKHFELLIGFWNHPNELLKTSIELTLELVAKQPSRLPEILKFIDENFKYNLNDRDYGYVRQHTLLDALLDENTGKDKLDLVNGIFLNVAKALLGWHYTETGSGKGRTFTFYNFDLYKSEPLLKLRERILNQVYLLFDPKNEQHQTILYKIIHPGGDIDKTIYIDELPIYQKFITHKLDNVQYSHCKFVKKLSEHLLKVNTPYPKNWEDFIKSEIMKLSNFLKPGWEYKENKSLEVLQKEKREAFDKFILSKKWNAIEKFLLRIDVFYKQQIKPSDWLIESPMTDIYVSIAKKNKNEFKKAIRVCLKIIFAEFHNRFKIIWQLAHKIHASALLDVFS